MRLRASLITPILLLTGLILTGCSTTTSELAAERAATPEPVVAPEPAPAQSAQDTGEDEVVVYTPEIIDPVADQKPGRELPFEAIGPVAIIAGTEVPASAYNAEVAKIVELTGGRISPKMVGFYKKQVLYQLVDSMLLKEEVDKAGVTVTDDEVEAQYKKFASRFPSKEQFDDYFKPSGLKEADVRAEMGNQLAQEKLLVQKYDIKVDDAKVRKLYDEDMARFHDGKKARFAKEEQVQASHILLKVSKDADDKEVAEVEKRAKALAVQAKAKGADFAALARKHSEGPSAPRGGDLGFFPARRMVKPFSDVAFKLKKGAISEPVRTRFGFHIIKTVDRREASLKPFDEVKEQLYDQLRFEQLREHMDIMLGEIKKQRGVEFMEENIRVNVEVPSSAKAPAKDAGAAP